MYISNSIWVLHTLEAGQNLLDWMFLEVFDTKWQKILELIPKRWLAQKSLSTSTNIIFKNFKNNLRIVFTSFSCFWKWVLPFFRVQKYAKKQISSSIWSAHYPNAGHYIQSQFKQAWSSFNLHACYIIRTVKRNNIYHLGKVLR